MLCVGGRLSDTRALAVTAANCVSLAAMADIDGFLVGGASLQGEGFASIVKGAKKPSASL